MESRVVHDSDSAHATLAAILEFIDEKPVCFHASIVKAPYATVPGQSPAPSGLRPKP